MQIGNDRYSKIQEWWNILISGSAIALSWLFAIDVWTYFYPNIQHWFAYTAFFFGVWLILHTFFRHAWMRFIPAGIKSKGDNTSWRGLKGGFWILVLMYASMLPPMICGMGLTLPRIMGTHMEEHWEWLFLFWAGVGVASIIATIKWVRPWIGRKTAPFRRWRRKRAYGKGGSATFAGMLDDWALQYNPGDVLLGYSLYAKKPKIKNDFNVFKVGYKDDKGLLTIGAPRSGKGRCCILPNLIEWPHSLLMIDPKGENTAITAARRGHGGGRVKHHLGQDVYVIDPFGEVKGVETACFNPLSAIDVNAPSVREDIRLIADALIVTEGGKNSAFFEEGARIILSGVMAHLLTKANPGTPPSLVDVRKSLMQDANKLDTLFGEMSQNNAAGNLPATAASFFDMAGKSERGAHYTTMVKNTHWLDSTAMAPILTKSTFKFSDLKNGHTTISLVLPNRMLNEHSQFLRLFVTLGVLTMQTQPISEKPVLFLLDEFFSLGTMNELEKAASGLPGFNLKLWPIVQDIGQLIKLYPENWRTFTAGAGVKQILGIGDKDTGDFVADEIGNIADEMMVGEHSQRVVRLLREINELKEEVSRKGGRLIVLRDDEPPLLLRRINYDKTYPKKFYNPNPFIKKS